MTHGRDTQYAACAFDFDGTLADTADLDHRAVQASLAAHRITVSLAWIASEPVFTAAQLRRRLGIRPPDLPQDTFAEAARTYWFAHTDRIRSIAASNAADHAAITVVSANYSDVVRHGLEAMGVHDLPWTVVGREETPRTKPAPDGYLHAARLLGITPHAASHTRTPTTASWQPYPQAWT
ncbi:HAD hydrolase-like protein [Streptomyces sp. NPDC102437]|uniref:HAD hydrolase-like protein n=1 Tax=Streptomyces sp. NPDC102437 TaxID=3366175 RepID=UPI00380EAFB8